ncbi:hypothetical protein [Arthrobacter sp. NPDC056493]|uniref:hypothetical protein n=1 Tax=Arthrobacter sp. NPDC056493 TaxID=3345839 RepID=UPI0036706EB5
MQSRIPRLGVTLAGSTLALAALLTGTQAASATVPAASSSSSYRLVLVSLDCRETEDWLGADEAYLRVHGVTVWGPQSMNDGDSLDINRSVPFSSTAKIRLYDADTGIFDNDDFLGEVTASASQVNSGEQYASFTQDGANYQLTYRVIPNRW